jgi:hypothetical protein
MLSPLVIIAGGLRGPLRIFRSSTPRFTAPHQRHPNTRTHNRYSFATFDQQFKDIP